MGLSSPLLRFLAREHRRQPFAGEVVTLGRQCVYATQAELLRMLAEEGVTPVPLPPDFSWHTNLPQWQGTANAQYISDVAFFRALGADRVSALDFSAFEGAELVADLNRPAPPEWEGRFDLIVDSGTLEHVFHLPQALANLGRMVRVGGRVIHLSPGNNYVNHGFYQFSPTLFADFYRANGWEDVRVFVGEERSHRSPRVPIDLFEITGDQPDLLMSGRRLMTLAVATKGPGATVDRIPVQEFYRRLLAPQATGQSGEETQPVTSPAWKRWLPTWLKTLGRRVWPGLDPNFRPWRLRNRGRLR